VGINALKLSEMGESYCGGVHGNNGRMRVLSAWTVASHRDNKCGVVVAEGDVSDTTLLCISCTPVGSSGKQSTVLMKPTLPSAKLSGKRRGKGDAFRLVLNQTDITKRTSGRSGPRRLYQGR
jgi:hypothetical protein